MQSQNLYFLALVPDGKTAGEVTALKEHIALQYNSSRALRLMPHITLKAPFTVPQKLMGEVPGWFDSLNLKTTPFTITLNGFNSFSNPNNPVIFIKPVASPQLLVLQQEIITAFVQQFPAVPLQPTEQVFSPHMTIAYRDLSYEMFEKAWEVFKDKPFHAEFEAHTVSLLQHDGAKWSIISEKKLG